MDNSFSLIATSAFRNRRLETRQQDASTVAYRHIIQGNLTSFEDMHPDLNRALVQHTTTEKNNAAQQVKIRKAWTFADDIISDIKLSREDSISVHIWR